MNKISLIVAFAAISLCLSSCTTTYVSDPGPKWYPYGSLKIFKQLGKANVFIVKGKSAKSSGITILKSDASTLEIDVTEIGEARFLQGGMFRVEVDGKALSPAETVARMQSDPALVVRRGGRVSYDLPSYYEKIVINFYDVELSGFQFAVKLTSP